MNLNDDPRGGTFCLSKAGLKIGNSDAKDVDIAAPNGAGVDFVINGVLYHKADAADIPVVVTNEDGTTVDTQAADTTCIYLVQLDSSGNLTTLKGEEVLTASADVVRFPTPSASKCAIGYIRIDTDGVTFLCGTDDFSKASVTDVYVDLFSVPVVPLSV
ncbi:MAG: hypothetical protein H8D87_04810 [Deltaproteobacteria bacterium]|nr:hypothetical protein [Candidatus Desulfobacula maris]